MSEARPNLTWDELDQLADYAAGALNDADAARIADLVRRDDRWAAAYAELTAAEPLVQAALREAAEEPVSMPTDVAARLDAAIARGPATRATPHPVIPARRRRRPVLTRVAAGVLALVAVGGVAVVARNMLLETVAPMIAAEDAGSAPGSDGAPGPAAAPSPARTATDMDSVLADTRVTASGTDYTLENLPELVHERRAEAAMGAAQGDEERFTADDPLAKLATNTALDQCLAAVRLRHPGEVAFIDFARFEGEPALVLLVRNGATSTIVVVGPDCGTAGVDERASVEVD